jgi:hypothetical protein
VGGCGERCEGRQGNRMQILALIALIAFAVTSVILGHWLLGPVNRAAGRLNAPTRFQMTDCFWLMIHLQVMLAVAMPWLRETVRGPAIFLIVGILGLPIVILWAASVSVVARAGITQPLRRAAVVLILVPGALAVIVAVPFFFVGLVEAVRPGQVPFLLPLRYDDSQTASRVGQVLLAGFGVVLAAIFMRWLSHWVLAISGGSPVTPAQAKTW